MPLSTLYFPFVCFLFFLSLFFIPCHLLLRELSYRLPFNPEFHYVLVTVSLMRMFYLCHLMLDRSKRDFLSFYSRLKETD